MRVIREIINRISFEVQDANKAKAANRAMDEAGKSGAVGARGVKKLDDEMSKAYKTGFTLGRTIRGVGRGILSFARGATSALANVAGVSSIGFAGLIAASIAAASNVQEAQSKMRDVLGDQADDLEAWAKANARTYSASTNELRMFATDFAVQFKKITTVDRSVDIAKDLTQRALDLASFSNKSATDVAADFTSAINGSTETVEKYGVNLKAAAVESFILSSGLRANKKDITEADKRLARYNILLRDTKDAAGNAARTSGDFANVLKNFRGRVADNLAEIGSKLIPVATEILQRITAGLENNQDAIVAFFGDIAQRVQDFIDDGGLQKIADLFGDIAEFAGVAAKGIDRVFNISEGEKQKERERREVENEILAIRGRRFDSLLERNPIGFQAAFRRNISGAVFGGDRRLAEEIVQSRRAGDLNQRNEFNIQSTDPAGAAREVERALTDTNAQYINNAGTTGEGL